MTALFALSALLFGATAGERVHPVAIPSRPAPTERVVLRFRTREATDGVYHAEARQRGCDAARSRSKAVPRKGRVVRFTLSAPPAGWCVGEHRATVYFMQTVHCPPKIQCGGSAEVPVGSTTFTVTGGVVKLR
jgi:hypothetical protein